MGGSSRGRTGHCFGRFMTVARGEGLGSALRRVPGKVLPNVRRSHFLVLSLRLHVGAQDSGSPDSTDRDSRRRERIQRMNSDFEIGEITSETDPDLDALPAVDGWTSIRDARIRWLRDGARCFLAKRDGQLIASTWLTTGTTYYEPHFKRQFDLAPEESYAWGAFCLPDRRGQGVMSRLMEHAMNEVASGYRKRAFVMIVSPSNRLSLRASEKIGFRRIGYTGFVEVPGLRFHYLLGARAFPDTVRRVFVTRTR